MVTVSPVTSQVYLFSAFSTVSPAVTTAAQSGKIACMVMALGGSISVGYASPAFHDHTFPVSGAAVFSVSSLAAFMGSADEIITQLVAGPPHTPRLDAASSVR